MQKLHFSVFIQAPKQKTWETMLQDSTYRQWTAEFNSSGSYYEGSWETGSDIKFLGPNEDGTVSGMIARIRESKPYDFVSIQHLGEILNNKEKLWSAEEQGANGFFENYTFTEKDGGTEVLVDVDSNDDWAAMFEDMWPRALKKLKEITENN